MAAKKRSNSSKDEDKNKAKPAAKKRGRPRKTPEPPKKEEPKVTDDDFGLDDISLDDGNLDEQVDELEPVQEEQKEEVVAPSIEETVEASVDVPIASEENQPEEPVAEEAPQEEEEEKKGGLMWLVIILVVLAIAALLYFFVLAKDEPAPAPVKKEQVQPKPEPKPAPKPEPEPAPAPEAAFYTISAPDGRFYVIVGSFYDVDLAEDKAKAIVAAGENAYLLAPADNFAYHRVGMAANADRAKVESSKEALKAQFGEDIWVVKY